LIIVFLKRLTAARPSSEPKPSSPQPGLSELDEMDLKDEFLREDAADMELDHEQDERQRRSRLDRGEPPDLGFDPVPPMSQPSGDDDEQNRREIG
jgi:hypothetical protein